MTSSLSSNLIVYLLADYVIDSKISIIHLVNLFVTNIIQFNILKQADIGIPNMKSSIIKYSGILIVLISCKFPQDL